jgi:hypothetical protein
MVVFSFRASHQFTMVVMYSSLLAVIHAIPKSTKEIVSTTNVVMEYATRLELAAERTINASRVKAIREPQIT